VGVKQKSSFSFLRNVAVSFQRATDALSPFGVEVIAHDLAWIEDKKMGSFLSVTKGSHEPPVFLEMIYSPTNAPDLKPVALVGKKDDHLLLSLNQRKALTQRHLVVKVLIYI
jgi:hypothetical protein